MSSYRPYLENLPNISLCKIPPFLFSSSSSLSHHLFSSFSAIITSSDLEVPFRLSSSIVLVVVHTELRTTMMIITLMRMRMIGRISISPKSITGKWPSAIYLLSDGGCVWWRRVRRGLDKLAILQFQALVAVPLARSGPPPTALEGITLSEKRCAISLF